MAYGPLAATSIANSLEFARPSDQSDPSFLAPDFQGETGGASHFRMQDSKTHKWNQHGPAGAKQHEAGGKANRLFKALRPGPAVC